MTATPEQIARQKIDALLMAAGWVIQDMKDFNRNAALGVWANNPIMVGVADVLACYDIPREKIKVLSLGCVKDEYCMGWSRNILGGMLFWTNLVFECMHIQSQNVIGQSRLIVGGDNVLRVDAEPISPKIELSDWNRNCEMLPDIAGKLFDKFGTYVEEAFLQETAEEYRSLYNPDSQP